MGWGGGGLVLCYSLVAGETLSASCCSDSQELGGWWVARGQEQEDPCLRETRAIVHRHTGRACAETHTPYPHIHGDKTQVLGPVRAHMRMRT